MAGPAAGQESDGRVMELETAANIAEIVGALSVIGGIIFAVAQIGQFRAQRRELVVVELMRSFDDPELVEAVTVVRELPDGATGADLRAKGREFERAAITICTTYETIGYLVFRRMLPFFMVRELAGGVALVMWQKLSPWVMMVRDEQAQPSWAEWFQWLAEQLARESEQKESNPAYKKLANWRPGKRSRKTN